MRSHFFEVRTYLFQPIESNLQLIFGNRYRGGSINQTVCLSIVCKIGILWRCSGDFLGRICRLIESMQTK